MVLQNLSGNFLTYVKLRLGVVAQVALKLNNVEMQVREGGAHSIEFVLGLHHKFIVTMRMSPFFLLFR
jgi:hypothetical protein